MNKLYSEKELLPLGILFGHWEFLLTNSQINEKINVLPNNTSNPSKHSVHWENILSLMNNVKEKTRINEKTSKVPHLPLHFDSPMDCLSSVQNLEDSVPEEADILVKSVEDITASLVDSCYQASLKPKSELSCIQEELSYANEDLEALGTSLLAQVVEEVWYQLHTDASKLCLCLILVVRSDWSQTLCERVLLPWMMKTLPSKLEQFSEVFARQSQIYCKYLITPLLRIEDSPFTRDILNLEEIMNFMSKKDWNIVLEELLADLKELHSWNIPVIATVIEHGDPLFDDICLLVQLMSSSAESFAKSRDFGALLVAVAYCIKPDFGLLVSQLRLIINSYKGPLKFKALNLLSD